MQGHVRWAQSRINISPSLSHWVNEYTEVCAIEEEHDLGVNEYTEVCTIEEEHDLGVNCDNKLPFSELYEMQVNRSTRWLDLVHVPLTNSSTITGMPSKRV